MGDPAVRSYAVIAALLADNDQVPDRAFILVDGNRASLDTLVDAARKKVSPY